MVARQTPQFNEITPRRIFLLQANVHRHGWDAWKLMRCGFLKRNIFLHVLMKHQNVQEYHGKTLQSAADLQTNAWC
jgi:hypothetical protein